MITSPYKSALMDSLSLAVIALRCTMVLNCVDVVIAVEYLNLPRQRLHRVKKYFQNVQGLRTEAQS